MCLSGSPVGLVEAVSFLLGVGWEPKMTTVGNEGNLGCLVRKPRNVEHTLTFT